MMAGECGGWTWRAVSGFYVVCRRLGRGDRPVGKVLRLVGTDAKKVRGLASQRGKLILVMETAVNSKPRRRLVRSAV